MKRSFIVTLMLIATVASSFGVDNAKRWKRKYDAAVDIKGKSKVVREMVNVAEAGFEPLLIRILEEQINAGVPSFFGRSEHEEWIKHVAYMAGELKIKEASPLLIKIYEEMKLQDAIIKGEILHAIGKINEAGDLAWLNNEMNEYNILHKAGGVKGQLETVYGLVKALEIYNSPESFSVLFYATLPNYNESIRGIAKEILQRSTDNPTPLCEEMIKDFDDMQIALEALRYGYYSNSPKEEKVKMIVAAVDTALDRMIGKDLVYNEVMRSIVNEGVVFLGDLKANSKEAIDVIEKKWNRDVFKKNVKMMDTITLLNNIEALQKIAGNDAAIVLQRKLKDYVDKKMAGSATGYGDQEGPKIMIAIIRAMGATGADVDDVIFELDRVADSERMFGTTLRNEAKKALKQLGF